MRIAHAQGRSDLVGTVIAPAAADGASVLLADARESTQSIRKYSQRLADVRARRLALSAAVTAAGERHGLEDRGMDVHRNYCTSRCVLHQMHVFVWAVHNVGCASRQFLSLKAMRHLPVLLPFSCRHVL